MFIKPKIFTDKNILSGFSFNTEKYETQEEFENALIGPKNKKMIFLNQKHTDKTALIPGSNISDPHDAAITQRKGYFLFLRTADCNPILFYEPQKKVIGAVHAGWRGLKSEIFTKTINLAVKKYHIDTALIKVSVGPSIRSCCYEVKDDLIKEFQNFEKLDTLFVKRGGKIHFNQTERLKNEILSLGIKEENIEIIDQCTHCSEKFFSYRENKTELRNLAFIAIT